MSCGSPNTDDDWIEWRNHILKELERQNNNIEALREKIESNEKNRLTTEGNRMFEIGNIKGQLLGQGAIVSLIVTLVLFALQYAITH